jgi:hypothetical protein
MTDQRPVIYVATLRTGAGDTILRMRCSDEEPISGNVVSSWRAEGAATREDAVAAVLLHAAGQYLGADVTVTQLVPRPRTADEQLEDARRVLRADYWSDVRNVVDDVRKAIEDREITTQDEVTEAIDTVCDGHQRVIYTGQAIECLLFSDNEDAYDEQGFGDLDLSDGGHWSRMAYFAFRADVADQLGDVAALLEDAKTFCADCDKDISDADDNVAVTDPPLYAGAAPLEVVLCSGCAAERQEGEDK